MFTGILGKAAGSSGIWLVWTQNALCRQTWLAATVSFARLDLRVLDGNMVLEVRDNAARVGHSAWNSERRTIKLLNSPHQSLLWVKASKAPVKCLIKGPCVLRHLQSLTPL